MLRVAALGPLEARTLLKSACIGCIELLDGIEAAAALKPRSVDAKVIVADCDAASPLASNWLPSLRHARASLLAPGAAVVPRALTVYASLVESEALASLGCVWQDATHGLDLRPLNALAHGSRAVRLSELPHSLLTDAAVALRLELDGAEPPAEAGEATTELVARRAGVAHAVVLWHDLDLGGDASVSTAPGEAGDARQVVLFCALRARAPRAIWASSCATDSMCIYGCVGSRRASLRSNSTTMRPRRPRRSAPACPRRRGSASRTRRARAALSSSTTLRC